MNKHMLLASAFSVLAFIPVQAFAQQTINPAQLVNITSNEAMATNDLAEISQAEARLTSSTLPTTKSTDQSQIVVLLQKLAFDEEAVSTSYQVANVTLVSGTEAQLNFQINELIAQNQILAKALTPTPIKGPVPLNTVAPLGNVNTQAVLSATRNVLLAELNLASTLVLKTSQLEPLPYGPLQASENQYFSLTNIINSTEQQIAALNGVLNPK